MSVVKDIVNEIISLLSNGISAHLSEVLGSMYPLSKEGHHHHCKYLIHALSIRYICILLCPHEENTNQNVFDRFQCEEVILLVSSFDVLDDELPHLLVLE
jgi:hypothetical protein